MNNFYVYAHYRPDNGQIFYIGKGFGRRANSIYNRNRYWNNIVKKHDGFDVKILNNNLTENKALELEQQYIKNIGLDNLANLTLGGEGTSGFKHSDETCQKMSKRQIGRKANLGKGKAILQFSNNNEFIKEWISAKEANIILNINHSNITQCLKNKRKLAGNFIWKYK